MPWLKVSDTAGNHPMVLAPLLDDLAGIALDGPLWANAVMGVVMRSATMSAGYTTDYFVADATVAQTAGPQWRMVADAAERAGYWTRADGGWLIVEDSTNFVHIRRADEIAWEKLRKKDIATPTLTVPVRLRDGDGCRYCGRIVTWGDNRSGRGATYDHRIPGQPAAGPDDLRIACRSCNARRGADPDADQWLPPRPVPADPHYGPDTRAYLKDHGYTVPAPSRRPGSQPDTAPSNTPERDRAASATPQPERDPATGRTPPPGATLPVAGHRAQARPRDPRDTAPPPTTERPGRASELATPRDLPKSVPKPTKINNGSASTNSRSADPANRRTTEPGNPGRVGTGRDGSGDRTPPEHQTARHRGRRARRGRPAPGGTPWPTQR
jgi:hypothetical protein